MSVREEVHQFLKDNAGTGYTNDQIASELALPEPSVRRATLQLDKACKVVFMGVTSRRRLLWMVQPSINGGVQRPATV